MVQKQMVDTELVCQRTEQKEFGDENTGIRVLRANSFHSQ